MAKKTIVIKDGDTEISTIELKDDIDLRYVDYAIVNYGENNDWFEKE